MHYFIFLVENGKWYQNDVLDKKFSTRLELYIAFLVFENIYKCKSSRITIDTVCPLQPPVLIRGWMDFRYNF